MHLLLVLSNGICSFRNSKNVVFGIICNKPIMLFWYKDVLGYSFANKAHGKSYSGESGLGLRLKRKEITMAGL